MTVREQPLNSTALSGARYDGETQELTVGFTSGGTYSFSNVPPEIYEGLVSAGSPGKYYHSYIKGIYG